MIVALTHESLLVVTDCRFANTTSASLVDSLIFPYSLWLERVSWRVAILHNSALCQSVCYTHSQHLYMILDGDDMMAMMIVDAIDAREEVPCNQMEGVIIEGLFNPEHPLPHAKEWDGLIMEESARLVKDEVKYVYLHSFASSGPPGYGFKYVGTFDVSGQTIYQYRRITALTGEHVLLRDVRGALVCAITKHNTAAGTAITASLMSGKVVFEQEYRDRDRVHAIKYRRALTETLIDKGYVTRHQTIVMVDASGHAIRGDRILKYANTKRDRQQAWQREAAKGTSMLKFHHCDTPRHAA